MVKVVPGEGRNQHPPDTGCREATALLGYQSKCVQCPFHDCIHHGEERYTTIRRKERANEIMRLHNLGCSWKEIMKKVGVSKQTVYRAIKDGKAEARKT